MTEVRPSLDIEEPTFSLEPDAPNGPLPVPCDDIERLLRGYDLVYGFRLDDRLLVRRVQRWLDSLGANE